MIVEYTDDKDDHNRDKRRRVFCQKGVQEYEIRKQCPCDDTDPGPSGGESRMDTAMVRDIDQPQFRGKPYEKFDQYKRGEKTDDQF
jgi:hypothetical protein